MIRELVLTTMDAGGRVHIAPLGLHVSGSGYIAAPFRPSRTLDNLQVNPFAVANFTDDVRVIAGCLTGRRDWPTRPASTVKGAVLVAALAHAELEVERVEDDPLRPRFHCRVVHEETHAPFHGFNRAKAAVVEAAILVSRLHMLPMDKIDAEIAYLRIAIDKTAGPEEREAWEWLMHRVAEHKAKAETSA